MIPKHASACLFLLLALSCNTPGSAAVENKDTAIGDMEVKLFSHACPGDAYADRLSRLEKFVFGTPNTDLPLNDRLSRLTVSMAIKKASTETVKAVNPVAPTQFVAGNSSTNLANVSSYPRVTQLELRLLGKSFFGEPIAKRLCRLEIAEFGKAVATPDLAARMDALSAIATSNVEKTRVNELASYQSPTTAVNNYRDYMYAMFQPTANAPKKEQPNTVVDQIEYLESAAFGKIHPNKSLQKRVGALEERYYGASKADDNNLTYRVSQLLTLVNNGTAKTEIAHG